MRYWLHDECGHAQAYSNGYHNGEKRNPHLTASLLELRTPGGTVIVALEPAGLSPFDARTRAASRRDIRERVMVEVRLRQRVEPLVGAQTAQGCRDTNFR